LNELDFHKERVYDLFARHIPSSTLEERMAFAVETYRGTQRHRDLAINRDGYCHIVDCLDPHPERLSALVGVSIMETNDDKRLQYAYAFLGGHRKTQVKGFQELGEEWDDDLGARIRALAYHFSLIHERHKLLEKVCRIWNQGDNWWTPKAKNYWLGVKKYKTIYEKGG
jgi:hypothetical protein